MILREKRASGAQAPARYGRTSGQLEPLRVTMLLENTTYPQDVRVRWEAKSLAEAGYRVLVIAPRGDRQPPRELVDGVLVERYRLPLVHSASWNHFLVEYVVAHAQLYARGIRALLRGTEVLHAHNPPDTLFPLGLLGRLLGCRFVFDQHDLFPELVATKYASRPLAGAARVAQRASMRSAHLVVTTNASQRDAALLEKGGSEDSVIIVRNGLPRTWLARPADYRSGALTDPHLVYVGVLEPQDGVDVLPEIMSLLLNDHGLRRARLTVVGDGSRLAPLRAQVEEQGLTEHVHFTGFISHERALAVIAGADICLDVAPCTDFNHQTTMVKIIEYLTLGRPTISFRLDETVRLAGDAIAYPEREGAHEYAAVVAKLAGSPSLRTALASRARTIASRLVWEHSAEALLDGYRKLDGAR
jgi:glycosyltransferase involved in cell wall biosynthesis